MIDENSRSLIPIRILKSGSRLNKIPKRVTSLDHQYYRRLTKVSFLVRIWITWRHHVDDTVGLIISGLRYYHTEMMVIGYLIVIWSSQLLNNRRFTMFIFRRKIEKKSNTNINKTTSMSVTDHPSRMLATKCVDDVLIMVTFWCTRGYDFWSKEELVTWRHVQDCMPSKFWSTDFIQLE